VVRTVPNEAEGRSMKCLLFGLLAAFAAAAQTAPTFNARTDIAAGQGVVAGDFNGDGIQDLVIAYGYEASQTFFGNGDGTFRSGPIDSAGSISDFANYAIDMNHDGKLDIIAPGAQCNSITVADMKGDGFRDVGAATGAGVEIFLNNGDGSLAPPTTLLGTLNLYGVGDLDLNGDGKPDRADDDRLLRPRADRFRRLEPRRKDGPGNQFRYGERRQHD
jgi:hypothetical protein